MLWSAQVEAILRAKGAWHVVHGDDEATSMLHGGEMDTMESGARNITEEELARYVACSLILQGLGDIPFSCVMVYRDDPRKFWKLLHQQYSKILTFTKATVHSSLSRTRYTEQEMRDYLA